jgi:hypothetical protein
MLPLILIAAGFVLGVAVRRSRVLLASVLFGIWVRTAEEVEVQAG